MRKRLRDIPKTGTLFFLGVYRHISEMLGSRGMKTAHCRYYPTCSIYGVEAVRRHGLARGGTLLLWRILRCNPFSRGGVDEVP